MQRFLPKPNKNERRRQGARERIIQVMQYLTQNQTPPKTASERAVWRTADIRAKYDWSWCISYP